MARNVEGTTFHVTEETLFRTTVPKNPRTRNETFSHTCGEETFKEVCHIIDEMDFDEGFSGEEIAEKIKRPQSQVFTAILFLYERGILTDARHKKLKKDSNDVFLDGMLEFHALDAKMKGICE